MAENVCKHCKENITHFGGKLWHDNTKVFPQYCVVNQVTRVSELHEPEELELIGESNERQ